MQFEILQGVLAGLMFGLGALLVTLLPKYKWLAASALCVLITPIALLPMLLSYGDLGISDWDYYFSMHTNIRETITNYHQLPLWNPYTCGGTSALGDPEFPALSPLFLLELIFGTPTGLRLSIVVSTALGALGMLHLARKLKIGPLGALVASLGMSFGTVNLLEIVEGHQNILAAMYIPWILYCWYSAYRAEGRKKVLAIITTAILLALMFFQGGIYLLMYMAGVFVFLILAAREKRTALIITLAAGILAIGLAGIKLIPVALWLTQFQDTQYASSAFTLWNIKDILLGRILYGAEDIIPNQGGGWHEYGAYVGPVLLTLAGIGVALQRKRRIVRILAIGGILALLVSACGPYFKPFFDAAPFIPRSNISRLILFTVIALSLLAGFSIDAIAKRSKRMHIYAIILLTLAAIDVMSLTYPLASQAFVLPHVTNTIPQAPYPLAYSPFDYKTRYNGVDYTRAYDATLKGYGNMSYCSVIGPQPAVRIITDEGGTGILSLNDDPNATFSIKKWTPNKAVFEVTATKTTSAILNTNYAKGWRINGIPAKEITNRPGIQIEPDITTLEFSYIPPGLYAGIGVIIINILIILILLLKRFPPLI
ncbi:MAG: hypothetical protein A2805_02105 [Candidatus Andersenbacteria bacterium RIFCSPHIGHO2_01_FULL_46_36]|nr:MAG: hypothetical protein A2805_02105 [Candidatus Andersenbacteria bacterium RIFCSPHIGHO2_01_FULL_46_36]